MPLRSLLLLASCAHLSERQVRVQAERGDLGVALDQACGLWFDKTSADMVFNMGREPWYDPYSSVRSTTNNRAWGDRLRATLLRATLLRATLLRATLLRATLLRATLFSGRRTWACEAP